MSENKIRLSVMIDVELAERLANIPIGLRSAMLRSLLVNILDAGEKHGNKMYGAIIDGEFDLVPNFNK